MNNYQFLGGAIAAIATASTVLPAQAGEFSFGVAPAYGQYPRNYPTRLYPTQRGFDSSSPQFLQRLDPGRSRSLRPTITLPPVILHQPYKSEHRSYHRQRYHRSDYPRSIYRQAYPQPIYPQSSYYRFGYPQRSRSTTIIIGPATWGPGYPYGY